MEKYGSSAVQTFAAPAAKSCWFTAQKQAALIYAERTRSKVGQMEVTGHSLGDVFDSAQS